MNPALENETDRELFRLFGARATGLTSRLVAALRQAVPVEEIWLFGSCARGEAKPDSDLDLLVVLADGHGLTRPTLACFKAVNHLPDIPPAGRAGDFQEQLGTRANPSFRTFWRRRETGGLPVCELMRSIPGPGLTRPRQTRRELVNDLQKAITWIVRITLNNAPRRR